MHPLRPTRRTLLAGLSALAVAPLLAACGDDAAPTSGSDTGGNGETAAAEENAFPATLTHKYGETTVEKAPARVVCVGLTDQDALIALGVAPVAISYWFGAEDAKGVYSWAAGGLRRRASCRPCCSPRTASPSRRSPRSRPT